MSQFNKVALVTELPTCDLCKEEPAEYDGMTQFGSWGYMCQDCYDIYGCGLGLGRGQKLVLETPATKYDLSEADELCSRCGKDCKEKSHNKQMMRFRVLKNREKVAVMLEMGLYCEEV